MTTQSAHREQYVLKFHLINLNLERIFILQNSNAEFSLIWGNTLTLGNQTIKIGVFTSRYYHLIEVVDCPLKKEFKGVPTSRKIFYTPGWQN